MFPKLFVASRLAVPRRAPRKPRQASPSRPAGRFSGLERRWLGFVVLLALAGGGYFAWLKLRPPGLPEGFASGNGRIEATEIDIDAKIPGRIQDVLVDE